MDAMEIISTPYLYAHNPSLEDRLKFLVNTISYFLDLDYCSIIFSSDEFNDYNTIASDSSKELMIDKDNFIFNGYRGNGRSDSGVIVFREMLLSENSSTGTERTSTEKIIAGADFVADGNLYIKFIVVRDIQGGEFSNQEITMIEKTLTSIKHEVNSEIRDHHRALFCDSTEKLLTRSRCGILLINKNLDVFEKSALIDDLLRELRVYSCTDNHLSGTTPEHQLELEQAIDELYSDKNLSHKIMGSIDTERGDRYTIAIRKNTPLSYNLLLETSFSLFIFSWREDITDLSPLFDMWQLSPAEKKVLTAIAQFDNIKKVAQVLNLSANTVKAQLKSAYKKLGIESKAMLFKRLNLVRKMDALLN